MPAQLQAIDDDDDEAYEDAFGNFVTDERLTGVTGWLSEMHGFPARPEKLQQWLEENA